MSNNTAKITGKIVGVSRRRFLSGTAAIATTGAALLPLQAIVAWSGISDAIPVERKNERRPTDVFTDVPTDFSDYSHYDLREEYGDHKSVPVYQSRSTGMLFAEDATPLIYVEGRLFPTECLASAMIEVSGSTEFLEQIVQVCPVHKAQFLAVLGGAS